MSLWFSARTIVEERDVQDYVDKSIKEFPRISEAWDGTKWILARSCHDLGNLTANLDGTSYFLVKFAGDAVAGTPHITVAYTFDVDTVDIVGLKFDLLPAEEQ